MWKPVQFSRPDLCQRCKKQAIEIYDYFGNSLNYKSIVDKWMNGIPIKLDNRYPIYSMKCKACGKEYKIVWNDEFPLPDLRSGGGLFHQFVNFYTSGGD